jgi:hypothetical protein
MENLLGMENLMKPWMISVFAVVAITAAASIMLRSPSGSIDLSAETAAMPALQDLHVTARVNKLPAQDIEDQSLVYPARATP